MKIKIKTHVFKKIQIDNFEIILPETKKYLFRFGERRCYCITPVWTTWNKEEYSKEEEIYKYDCIIVDQYEIKKAIIAVSDIEEIYNEKSMNPQKSIVDWFIQGFENREIRTREQFMIDFNKTISNISENL